MKKRFYVLSAMIILCILLSAVCLAACDTTPKDVEVTVSVPSHFGQANVSAPKNGEYYLLGERLTLTVVPDEGYVVSKVLVNGEKISLENLQATIVLNGNTHIEVEFSTQLLVIENDDNKGTVSLSEPQNGDCYVIGEQVQITVNANEHFSILSVFNGEKELILKNGSTTVVLSNEQTVIKVSYLGEALNDANALKGIQKNVRFLGEYLYDIDDETFDDTHNCIDTVFGIDSVRQLEWSFDTNEVYYDSTIIRSKEDPRYIAFIQRTINNEVVEVTNKNFYFNDYYNQFDLLSVNDFEYVRENVYSIIDKDKAKLIASAITGWTESIDSFLIFITEGVVSRVQIITAPIALQGTEDVHYVSTYDFEVSEHGTANVNPSDVQPYEHTADHDVLSSALNNAQDAAFYTVNHFAHEVGYVEPEGGETRPGYGDLDYYVYITEDMVYDAYPGEEHGFKVRDDYVFPFNVEQGKVVLLDPVNVADISQLQATFNGFSPEIFKYVGEGKYVLRDNTLASEIGEMLGEGNEKTYYSYATTLAITLNNGKLHKIEFITKTYGISEEITLTYDFDTPVDVGLDFDSATKESILDPFKGTYADSEGNYAVVDASGFTINGIKATVVAYDSTEGIFTLDWNGKRLGVRKISLKQMFVMSEDYTFSATFTMLGNQIVQIPQNFRGVWAGVFEDEIGREEYKFEIQSYVVKLYDKVLKVLSYSDKEGLICEDDNGDTYMFGFVSYLDGTSFTSYHIKSNGEIIPCILELTGEEIGLEIPIELVGTFIREGTTEDNPILHITHRVDITPSQITINGEVFEIKSYDSDTKTFVGKLGSNENYTIGFPYSVDQLILGETGDMLRRTDVILPTYIGTWESSDGTYLVTIDETSVCINGTYVQFTLDSYGITFDLEGSPYKTHIIYLSSGADGKITLWMYDNNELLKSLTKLGESDDTTIPSQYIGTFSGTSKFGKEYVFNITAEETTVSIDGEAVVADKAYFDYDALIIEIGDTTYIFTPISGTEYWSFYIEGQASNGDYCFTLTKQTE